MSEAMAFEHTSPQQTDIRKWLSDPLVAICRQECGDYPDQAPFDPPQQFPETYLLSSGLDEANSVYPAVRNALYLLGLDVEHFGTPQWNPLGRFIRPGDIVVLKPNLIRESHQYNNTWQHVVTHGSVIRAVLDYVAIALQGQGTVVIADGPQTDSNFQSLCKRLGLTEIVDLYSRWRNLRVELLDLRRERWFSAGDVIYKRESLPGDPQGYPSINLGDASAFFSYRGNGRFYGADYDWQETVAFHTNGRHEYILSGTALNADVFINLPKLKTHKKVGVTLSLKNLVGINGYRNCLPHHTIGTPQEGGDEFPDSTPRHQIEAWAIRRLNRALAAVGQSGAWARWVKRIGKVLFGDTAKTIRSGNWYGNDTAWRMVLDLNKILFHFDASGHPCKRPLRYLTLVDGIIGGEGDGPMAPDPRAAGLIVVGLNPVAVDVVCAHLMGFDYRKIPMLREAFEIPDLPLANFTAEDIQCVSNVRKWCGGLRDISQHHLDFEPHFGWKKHIELDT